MNRWIQRLLSMLVIFALLVPGNLAQAQSGGTGSLSSIDEDADGLTNTQEAWWCTNPASPDSDNDGRTDGSEIQALKDWLANQRATAPGETPWASWPFNTTTCPDKDYDSIPNLAELELGLDMDFESSDRDKFDDGQELFGVTYCPGGDLSCGYGDLPRSSDSGYVGATLPGWVKAPGNHPLVAAYPQPEVDVLPSSLHVQTVTVVTTDHVIGSGTERTYSTAKTEGTSTSVANTVTWNEWQEASESFEQRIPTSLARSNNGDALLAASSGWGKGLKIVGGVLQIAGGVAVGAVGCGVGGLTAATGVGAPVGIGACIVAAGTAAGAIGAGLDTIGDAISEDQVQQNLQINQIHQEQYSYHSSYYNETNNQTTTINQGVDTENLVKAIQGTQYSYNQTGQVLSQQLYQISNLIASPVQTNTTTQGKSWGGAQTTTTEEYEEHTITNGEAFSSEESWGSATAVDAAHAADFWFTYTVMNSGMEYAREIGDLSFNIYLDDNPDPIYTYTVAPDLGGDGKFHNFLPGESHTYTARHIPLSLEQMKAIDTGATLRVVVEDYTYGVDELFYQNAANAGVQIAIEDGTDDGNETIDAYVIPVFTGDTVVKVLKRYFPLTLDENDELTAIWTPEYRAETPAWCAAPKVVGAGASRAVWCKHALSTADWWNIYTNSLGDGSLPLNQTATVAGGTALFRFNKDSDLDGYSDRSEARLGTDAADPADYPQPELIAGLHSTQSGNNVVATLSLFNTGVYDAYGVEAVLVAPDDSITITNNTVGGSGRVKSAQTVVVGSRILPAATGSWTGTAKPSSSGYYTGTLDRSYSFSVVCAVPGGCDVGSGTWSISWSDGQGATGSLNFGEGYASPTPLSVGAYGLQVGLVSGRVYNANTFSVTARTPRDTFQYTINREPHADPVVIVSYNDPQGNHRFILPSASMSLSSPTADLLPFSGQMLQEPGVEIVTADAFAVGANTIRLVVNNPSGQALSDARLYLEFIDELGAVVHEATATHTFAEGPDVVELSWNTSAFSPAYDPEQEYIVLAFWTDREGNIIDTAGRPLSSFQQDPSPLFVMAGEDASWDFGSVPQGSLLSRTFTFANTGQMELLTYVSAPAGVSVSQVGSRVLGPADATGYQIALNTAEMTLGAYDQTITIRTSDPENPQRSVQVTGTVTAALADTPAGAVQRPLDYSLAIPGAHNQYDWYAFTHPLGPDPQTLHPVKLLSSDYGTEYGTGRYATDFGAPGMASSDMYGNGEDGDLTINSAQTLSFCTDNAVLKTVCTTVASTASMGGSTVTVGSASGFVVGQEVLIIQMQGTNTGLYEFQTIQAINGNILTFSNTLENTFTVGGSSKAQLLKVPHYHNVTVQANGYLAAKFWDGNTGGIVVFRANGLVTIEYTGYIDVSGRGYRGAPTNLGTAGTQGESINGMGTVTTARNANGGGGGCSNGYGNPGGGGGGGYGTAGQNGQPGLGNGCMTGGEGGNPAGAADLSQLYFGGGGGNGGAKYPDGPTNFGGAGGNGGGIIIIYGKQIDNQYTIRSFGSPGATGNGGGQGSNGGGGGGGSVFLTADSIFTQYTQAVGGPYGKYGSGSEQDGGEGGVGRIRIDYCDTYSAGETSPAAQVNHLTCFVAEQIETPPYDQGRVKLPETFANGMTYQVQYGRRLVYAGAGEQTVILRAPGSAFAGSVLDTLISGVGTGSLTYQLDVGNDGAWDWTYTGEVTDSISLTSSDLSSAFNAYWAAHGAPTSGTLDVPIRVSLDKPGQVLLTNLQVTPAGAKQRQVRLPVENYATFGLTYSISGATGPAAIGIDVGADGTVEDAWPTTLSGTTSHTTQANLASALNAYLSGQSGAVDVPIRVFLSPSSASFSLTGVSTTLAGQADAAVAVGDIHLPGTPPVESEVVALSATLHNNGPVDTGGVTAVFYATPPDGPEWYIGSDYLTNIPRNGSAEAEIEWDTHGFSGVAVPVRVEIDPYDRVDEASETNNNASISLEIRTRADVVVESLDQPETELIDTQPASIQIAVSNAGQTDAAAQVVALYDGNPETGGVLIGEQSVAIAGGSQSTLSFAWTPDRVGTHRLFVLVDRENSVNEAQEGNNLGWKDVAVGLKSPLLLDSGTTGDLAYTTLRGYGYVDSGRADVLSSCGGGTLAEETLRRDPDGSVQYRFDNLVPTHAYHLDVILFECDGAGRQESVYVDTYRVAGEEDLGDGQVHRLSILVDPALYLDRSLAVTISAPGIVGAVVGAVNLHDVDYRYIDAGSSGDVAYPGTKQAGWVDSTSLANVAWGQLPYQSVRIDQGDNNLSYRFDSLKTGANYRLHLTFWQPDGAAFIQKVTIDGVDTNLQVNTGDYTVHHEAVTVPQAAYQGDGSIVVSIERLGANGAMVNELALEEETLSRASEGSVQPTPYFTEVYGNALINIIEGGDGQPATVGTVIQAFSPRGDLVGAFTVSTAGYYGYMRIYGEDVHVTPAIPGMRAGELVSFRINGAPAVAKPSFYWQSDQQVHQVNLSAGSIIGQPILLMDGWNFVSYAVAPPSPLVNNVLQSVLNRYDRVLSETAIFDTSLPGQANSLIEMPAGQGYYIHVTGTTSANLLVDGLRQAANTPIQLHQGWNWVGYYPASSLPIADALQSIAGHYQLVHNHLYTYNPSQPIFNTLTTMTPGEGYMIYADTACELVYPVVAGGQEQAPEQAVVQSSADLTPTPFFTVVYGDVQINGSPAPAGTRVDVLTPRGDVAGRIVLTREGVMGYTHVYGATSQEAGFQEGEEVIYRVDGVPAVAQQVLAWSDDRSLHAIQLEVTLYPTYLPLIGR